MKYKNIYKATFLKRINRFIAEVSINDKKERIHVRNTGRCKELFVPGAKIFIEFVDKASRKTKYSLVSVFKEDELFNVDSQIPNAVVEEGINNNTIQEFNDIKLLRREKNYKNSRFDIYFERKNNSKGFVEVKGVTLEKNNVGMFPDAPTTRGTKHLRELINAKENGYEAYIFFLAQFNSINHFIPNYEMDPEFGKMVNECEKTGVKILVYNSKVTENSIQINQKIPYQLKI